MTLESTLLRPNLSATPTGTLSASGIVERQPAVSATAQELTAPKDGALPGEKTISLERATAILTAALNLKDYETTRQRNDEIVSDFVPQITLPGEQLPLERIYEIAKELDNGLTKEQIDKAIEITNNSIERIVAKAVDLDARLSSEQSIALSHRIPQIISKRYEAALLSEDVRATLSALGYKIEVRTNDNVPVEYARRSRLSSGRLEIYLTKAEDSVKKSMPKGLLQRLADYFTKKKRIISKPAAVIEIEAITLQSNRANYMKRLKIYDPTLLFQVAGKLKDVAEQDLPYLAKQTSGVFGYLGAEGLMNVSTQPLDVEICNI